MREKIYVVEERVVGTCPMRSKSNFINLCLFMSFLMGRVGSKWGLCRPKSNWTGSIRIWIRITGFEIRLISSKTAIEFCLWRYVCRETVSLPFREHTSINLPCTQFHYIFSIPHYTTPRSLAQNSSITRLTHCNKAYLSLRKSSTLHRGNKNPFFNISTKCVLLLCTYLRLLQT